MIFNISNRVKKLHKQFANFFFFFQIWIWKYSRGQKEMWLAVWRISVFSVIKTVNVMEKFLWILRSITKYISDIIKPKASISYSRHDPAKFSFLSFFFLFCFVGSQCSLQESKASLTLLPESPWYQCKCFHTNTYLNVSLCILKLNRRYKILWKEM